MTDHPWRLDLSNSKKKPLVDFQDYQNLRKHNWILDSDGYAVRHLPNGKGLQRLHREVMGLEPGDPRVVDHENRNPMDNRRQNLRVVAGRRENNQNRDAIGGTSDHRGVHWDKRREKWIATGHKMVDGASKSIYIGGYDDEEEAAQAAREWREENLEYSHEG